MAQKTEHEDQGYVNLSESGGEVIPPPQSVTSEISDSELYGTDEAVSSRAFVFCADEAFWLAKYTSRS